MYAAANGPNGRYRSTRRLAGVLLALACSTSVAQNRAPPNDQMALARTAIEQAQTAGATEAAPLELKFAQDRYTEATALLAKDRRRDYPQARRLAEQAESAARLAAAKAEEARAENALAEVRESIEVMRQEAQQSARP